MTAKPPRLSPLDWLATALLAVGCVSGMVGLLLRHPSAPPHPPATRELQQRVRELEQRLLEQVPRAVERTYRDL